MANYIKIALIAFGTLFVMGLGYVAYLVNQPFSEPPSGVAYLPQGEPPPFRSPSIDGQRLYKSPILHFLLYYPDDLFVLEYGAGNTSTLTFEDEKGSKGFQVFVAPYEGDTVSNERFKMDIPSGKIIDQQEITIDGTRGSAFFSEDALIGETREVWFIHGGFLYEVTARKELDEWLAGIMKTWKFE